MGKIVKFDSHENTAESIKEKAWIPKLIRGMVYFAYSWYQSRICKVLDGVICVSPNAVDYFKRLNNSIEVITNFPILNEYDNNVKKRQIVFAGGISEQWNHYEIIEALYGIEDCKYILCGPITDDYLNKLKLSKGWGKVDYRGIVPHTEVMDILSESLIGIALLKPGNNTD